MNVRLSLSCIFLNLYADELAFEKFFFSVRDHLKFIMRGDSAKKSGNTHKQSHSDPSNLQINPNKVYEQYKAEYENERHLLVKKDKFFGKNVTRWFQIQGNQLTYYKKQDSKRVSKVVSLLGIQFEEASSKLKEYPYCIKIQKQDKRIFWLHQKDEKEKQFLINYLKNIQLSPATDINNVLSKDSSKVSNSKGSGSYDRILDSGSLNLSKKVESEKVESTKDDHVVHKTPILLQKVTPRQKKDSADTSISKSKLSSGEFSEGELGPDDHIMKRNPDIKDKYVLTDKVENFFKKHPNFRYSECNTLVSTNYPPHKDSRTVTTLHHNTEKIDLRIISNENHYTLGGTDKDEEIPSEIEISNNFLNVRNQVGFRDDGLLNVSFSRSFNATPTHDRSLLQSPDFRGRSFVIGPHIQSELQSPISKKYQDDLYLESYVLGDYKASENREKRKSIKMVFPDKEVLKDTTDIGQNSPRSEKEENFYEELRKIKSIDECITQGHHYMWTYQIEKAKKCFLLYKYEDKLLELLRVECNIMDIAISGNEKRIKEVLNELTALYNKVSDVEISPKDDLNKYVSNELNKAEILIYRCGMHLFLGNKFQTLKNLAEGWRCYKRLESIFEKKKDQINKRNAHRFKFGHGCFNLAFSLIPSGILRIIKFIGINPDKEAGLKALEECRQDDDIRSNYCILILALYTIEFEIVSDKACEYLLEAIQKWNKCPFFYWIGSIICWKYCQVTPCLLLLKPVGT